MAKDHTVREGFSQNQHFLASFARSNLAHPNANVPLERYGNVDLGFADGEWRHRKIQLGSHCRDTFGVFIGEGIAFLFVRRCRTIFAGIMMAKLVVAVTIMTPGIGQPTRFQVWPPQNMPPKAQPCTRSVVVPFVAIVES